MQKSERVVQSIHAQLDKMYAELESSRAILQTIDTPSSGKMAELLQAKRLLTSQRVIIEDCELHIVQIEAKLKEAQEHLRFAMIEYEKFNYLEVQEIKKIEDAKKLQEAKDLDEVALMTFKQPTRYKEEF